MSTSPTSSPSRWSITGLLTRETTVARVTPLPPRRLLVAGAGLAAARTVASLRARGFDGHVTVLGAEGVAPYDRPPLSKHLLDRPEPAWLADEVGADLVALADAAHLDRPARALTVGAQGVRVGTDDGDLEADALVVATGARAVLPEGWEGARTLHTAADAAALRAALAPGARLVVVGAGWIGAEVAGVAAAAGVEVTVVEARAPLSGALGAVGRLTEPWYARAGVRLLTGARVVEVRGDGVRTTDDHLPADVVLVAVGARPATGWLGDALPREPDGSVRVDEHHAVVGAPPHVRAVGDVALRRSRGTGGCRAGTGTGRCAGRSTSPRRCSGSPPTPRPTTSRTSSRRSWATSWRCSGCRRAATSCCGATRAPARGRPCGSGATCSPRSSRSTGRGTSAPRGACWQVPPRPCSTARWPRTPVARCGTPRAEPRCGGGPRPPPHRARLSARSGACR